MKFILPLRQARPGPGFGIPTHVAAVALVLCLGSSAVTAQSLNCNGALAGVGDSKVSVLQKCGPPMASDLVCVKRLDTAWGYAGYPGAAPQPFVTQLCEPMEDLTYHRGDGNFLGIVRIRNGTVESVRDGDRMR